MGSHAPFGYIKSPEDKHKLIVDEIAAQVVRCIFNEFCSGVSARAICDRMNIEKVDAPRFYLYNHGYGQKPKASEHNSWTSSTVLQMLQNQAYIGNMVQGKREVISFKTKKRRQVDPSDWIIVEDTHEPIIDREVWDSVQTKRAAGTHHIRRTKETLDTPKVCGIFSGFIYCRDCGWKMAFVNHNSYRCSNYNNAGKAACSSHLIREATLSNLVLSDIKKYAILAQTDREKIRQRVIAELSKVQISETKLLEKQIHDLEAKRIELENALKSLYLDKCKGTLTEAQFGALSKSFSEDAQDVTTQLKTSYEALQTRQSTASNVDEWLARMEDCLEIRELNRAIVAELIDKIIVGAKVEHTGKSYTQDINIQYRFVGNISDKNEEAPLSFLNDA